MIALPLVALVALIALPLVALIELSETQILRRSDDDTLRVSEATSTLRASIPKAYHVQHAPLLRTETKPLPQESPEHHE